MPNAVPSQNGTRAQRAAARKYGLDLRAPTTGFLDARHRSNGSPVQVKSALYERAGGEPGVFRVWREHLRTLRDHGGSVVLVVVNPENPTRKVLRVVKRSPSTLLDRADFRVTGQDDMQGMREGRLPWPEVVDL